MKKYLYQRLQEELEDMLNAQATKMGYETTEIPLLRPMLICQPAVSEGRAVPRWGMSSTLAFLLGRRNAKALAEQLAQSLLSSSLPPWLETLEARNGYLNFFFSTPYVVRHSLKEILSDPEYGAGEQKGTTYMVEYSQPNTHKAFHIGHLRNAVLGNALVNILRFAGYPTISANYIGDSGAHVLLCLWKYQKDYQDQSLGAHPGKWLGEIYAEASAEMQKKEENALRAVYHLLKQKEWQALLAEKLQEQKALMDFFASLSLSEEEFLHRSEAHTYIFSRLLEALKVYALGEQTLPFPLSEEHLLALRDYFQAQKELKQMAQKWEEKDPLLISDWVKTREWSLTEFRRIYEELGIRFDIWFYESQMEQEGKKMVQELLTRGVAEFRDGAIVVDLSSRTGQADLGVLVLLRSDGTALYSTKDLALARKKVLEYGVEKSLYVVAEPQALYFRQLFATLDLFGLSASKNFLHLSYQVVMLPEGLISSRAGRMVTYDDLAQTVRQMAAAIVREKNPHLPAHQQEEIARHVADGAIKFHLLSREKEKVILFRPEEALSFEGYSAPYLQYVVARCHRILSKSPFALSTEWDKMDWENWKAEEVLLMNELLSFPRVIQACVERYEPFYLSQGLYEMGKAFSAFYHTCPVITSPQPIAFRRLALVESVRQLMRKGLTLLGIHPLSKM